jgi:hypothetical protein
MDSADYLRAELHNAAEHEMIVKLDDFMRRRSKIDLVVHDDDIRNSPGLREVAEILFGDRPSAASRSTSPRSGRSSDQPASVPVPVSVPVSSSGASGVRLSWAREGGTGSSPTSRSSVSSAWTSMIRCAGASVNAHISPWSSATTASAVVVVPAA